LLIARLSDGRFVIGIDSENMRRLKKGEPMKLDLVNFGGVDSALLMYGESLGDVMRELEKALGRKLPHASPLPDQKVPS
jgi:hypothetical protein